MIRPIEEVMEEDGTIRQPQPPAFLAHASNLAGVTEASSMEVDEQPSQEQQQQRTGVCVLRWNAVVPLYPV